MAKIPLSLDPDAEDQTDSELPESIKPGSLNQDGPGRIPIMGAAAVAFGILGIFTKGYIFVPLALLFSIISLFMKQIPWAFIGFLLTVAGLLTSPILLALLGIAWLLP